MKSAEYRRTNGYRAQVKRFTLTKEERDKQNKDIEKLAEGICIADDKFRYPGRYDEEAGEEKPKKKKKKDIDENSDGYKDLFKLVYDAVEEYPYSTSYLRYCIGQKRLRQKDDNNEQVHKTSSKFLAGLIYKAIECYRKIHNQDMQQIMYGYVRNIYRVDAEIRYPHGHVTKKDKEVKKYNKKNPPSEELIQYIIEAVIDFPDYEQLQSSLTSYRINKVDDNGSKLHKKRSNVLNNLIKGIATSIQDDRTLNGCGFDRDKSKCLKDYLLKNYNYTLKPDEIKVIQAKMDVKLKIGAYRSANTR